MYLSLISDPYDSGHKNRRMGTGPAVLEAFIASKIRDAGQDVVHKTVEIESQMFNAEISSTFELGRRLSVAVQAAIHQNRFPIVFSGNCNAAVGTLAGLGSDVATLWFDAHGEFNTPDTTESGFLDGMALAIITGRCWKRLASMVPGFRASADQNVVLVGAGQLDGDEGKLLDASGVTKLNAEKIVQDNGTHKVLRDVFSHMGQNLRGMYVHVDLDILDSRVLAANEWAGESGIDVEHILEIIRVAKDQLPVLSAGFASYDPCFDIDSKAPDIVFQIVNAVLQ